MCRQHTYILDVKINYEKGYICVLDLMKSLIIYTMDFELCSVNILYKDVSIHYLMSFCIEDEDHYICTDVNCNVCVLSTAEDNEQQTSIAVYLAYFSRAFRVLVSIMLETQSPTWFLVISVPQRPSPPWRQSLWILSIPLLRVWLEPLERSNPRRNIKSCRPLKKLWSLYILLPSYYL